MKTLITSLAVAATLGVLTTSPAEAQLVFKPSKLGTEVITAPSTESKTDPVLVPTPKAKDRVTTKSPPIFRPAPKGKDVITTPPSSSTLKRPYKNKDILQGGLGIASIHAKRVGDKIEITAIVNNTSAHTKKFDFGFTTRAESDHTWIPVKGEGGSGRGMKIGAGESFRLTTSRPTTNERIQIILDITGVGGPKNEIDGKDVWLKARPMKFLVAYGTNGEWIEARNYPDDLSNGFDASELARLQFRPLGLDTKVKTLKRTSVDGLLNTTTRYYTTLFMRSTHLLTKDFENRIDAAKFRKALMKLSIPVNPVIEEPLE